MLENFIPLNDKALIKRVVKQNCTESGIIIPDELSERVQTGTVLSVGPGRTDNSGKLINMQIKKNDIVYFGKHAGTEIEYDHVILREDEILGIIAKN